MKAILLQAVALSALAAVASAQVPTGGEFQVNTSTSGAQSARGRAVGFAANGDFVVVWQSWPPTTPSTWDVRGQLFDASGARRGAEFFVAESGFYPQFLEPRPSVGVDAAGNFVVVWWEEFFRWSAARSASSPGATTRRERREGPSSRSTRIPIRLGSRSPTWPRMPRATSSWCGGRVRARTATGKE